jgi:hypothetical protein
MKIPKLIPVEVCLLRGPVIFSIELCWNPHLIRSHQIALIRFAGGQFPIRDRGSAGRCVVFLALTPNDTAEQRIRTVRPACCVTMGVLGCFPRLFNSCSMPSRRSGWIFLCCRQPDLWIPGNGGRLRVTPYREVPAWRVRSLDMKKILYLIAMVALLSTTGCIVAEGERGGHGHARYEHHDEVIVGPPVVEVRAPVLVARPPEVIVR